MFFSGVISILLIIFLAEEALFFKKLKQKCEKEKEKLSKEHSRLKKEEKTLRKKVNELESSLSERFLFYDLTRRIAPLLDKKELFSTFSEEIKYLGPIDKIKFSGSGGGEEVLRFKIGKGRDEVLEIGTKSKNVIEYMPYFVTLLRLCLERIKLYNKFQELSILDSLTKVYNRRHFMFCYGEEFDRTVKFKLNLGFLMIDIDYFKKINDNYGHLVGDAVLREVARIIRENLREIDSLARFGGEEFSVMLPETDKASAIMAAERISSRVSQERIKVFDEALSVSISVGVATFPQNTLYPDVLIEVADKALYKAKLSGRNRVCWF